MAQKIETHVADKRTLAQASEAGLRYTSDIEPGLRRRRQGKHFRYFDRNGVAIRDQVVLARIARLAIPPAYADVWICESERGHLQATGRDARGCKQYRYHAHWRTGALCATATNVRVWWNMPSVCPNFGGACNVT